MNQPLPVYLITGLLGSGKTTLLTNLIKQKPSEENWVVLINEFGEVDIDSTIIESMLDHQDKDSVIIESVSGGCICCTAHIALPNTLNQTLKQHTDIDRLIIEPTGLGHPAKIIDLLSKPTFYRPLKLIKNTCLVTPMQMTEARWKKSQVMRDLVNLADEIVINKIDLASKEELGTTHSIINRCYPPKENTLETAFSELKLTRFLTAPKPQGLKIIAQTNLSYSPEEHFKKSLNQVAFVSSLPSVISSSCGYEENNIETPLSIGWIWQNDVQFKRTELLKIFAELTPFLQRAKGVLKTGNEWQLLQWSDNQLTLTDIAWRQDSRLECLFNKENPPPLTPKQIEARLLEAVNLNKKS